MNLMRGLGKVVNMKDPGRKKLLNRGILKKLKQKC